jgi:hypothetical protein
MLGVDLIGSRRIEPAHVGWLIGPDGSSRIQKDRLEDQTDDQSASDKEIGCLLPRQVISGAMETVLGCTLVGASSVATWIRSRPASLAS